MGRGPANPFRFPGAPRSPRGRGGDWSGFNIVSSDLAWAVRSSAPGEDSAHRSFAGLHESYGGVVGCGAVIDAVRLVWASLWSDASMLYRREVGLDPARSRMAVLVQAMRTEAVSGVAFGCDPRQLSSEIAIVEAVPGLCAGLVDGQIDPDRWLLRRSDGKIVEWRPGQREQAVTPSPLLAEEDLSHLLRVLKAVESLFAWPPDIEWTGCRERFTLLQARPITTVTPLGTTNGAGISRCGQEWRACGNCGRAWPRS